MKRLAIALVTLSCAGTAERSRESSRLLGSAPTPGLGAGEVEPAEIDVAACRGSADVAKALAIVEDFRVSAREMIVCGNVVFAFISGIGKTFVKKPDAALRFDPATRRYRAGAEGFDATSMEIGVKLGADYTFGAKGEVVTADLSDPETFLAGATVALAKDRLTITFAAPGPVELLGQGASPVSPLVVDKAARARFETEVGRLIVDGSIAVIDTEGQTATTYQLDLPGVPIGELLAQTRSMKLPFKAGGAQRSDLGQRLVVDRWEVQYVDGVKGLDGTIDFHVEGGPFPFAASFVYRKRPEPKITIRCAK